jgi:catalase
VPLPADEKLLTLSERIVQHFDTIFGLHPGFRSAHAKGILLIGIFTPSAAASTLSSAAHLQQTTTPITVRFSNSTGIPLIPDTDPNANPRGMGVRFNLAPHVHTDTIAQSTEGSPTRTGEEFLGFLSALAASGDPALPHPTPVEAFVGSHPATLAFVQAPKPPPSSFARESFFGVSALKFTNAAGVVKFGRFRILPTLGSDHLDAATAATLSPTYLFDELTARVAQGPVGFRLFVQIAEPSDIVDDATIHWPEERTLLELGELSLSALVADDAAEQKQIIFDPIPRVAGIEPSADPLVELRAAVYLISGRRRRAAN